MSGWLLLGPSIDPNSLPAIHPTHGSATEDAISAFVPLMKVVIPIYSHLNIRHSPPFPICTQGRPPTWYLCSFETVMFSSIPVYLVWGVNKERCCCIFLEMWWCSIYCTYSVFLICCSNLVVLMEFHSPPSVWLLLLCRTSFPSIKFSRSVFAGDRLGLAEAPFETCNYLYLNIWSLPPTFQLAGGGKLWWLSCKGVLEVLSIASHLL